MQERRHSVAVNGASAPNQAPQQRGSASARGANAGAAAHIDRPVQRSRRAAMQYFGGLDVSLT
jgi:hypothetical protein